MPAPAYVLMCMRTYSQMYQKSAFQEPGPAAVAPCWQSIARLFSTVSQSK